MLIFSPWFHTKQDKTLKMFMEEISSLGYMSEYFQRIPGKKQNMCYCNVFWAESRPEAAKELT